MYARGGRGGQQGTRYLSREGILRRNSKSEFDGCLGVLLNIASRSRRLRSSTRGWELEDLAKHNLKRGETPAQSLRPFFLKTILCCIGRDNPCS